MQTQNWHKKSIFQPMFLKPILGSAKPDLHYFEFSKDHLSCIPSSSINFSGIWKIAYGITKK